MAQMRTRPIKSSLDHLAPSAFVSPWAGGLGHGLRRRLTGSRIVGVASRIRVASFAGWARSQVWTDLRKGLAGLRAMIRFSRSTESPSLTLSALSCDSFVAREGYPSWLNVTIANETPDWRRLKLVIDIYRQENGFRPEGHFGYFDKVIVVGPRDTQNVQIGFDWKESAVFRIEGVDLAADGFWRGPCRTAGVYSVKAIAAGEQGQTLAQLEIHQKLS